MLGRLASVEKAQFDAGRHEALVADVRRLERGLSDLEQVAAGRFASCESAVERAALDAQ